MDKSINNCLDEQFEVNDQSLLYCHEGAGEVVDISMKGLSFHQLTGTNWPTGAFKIDLLLENSTLLIEQIPCSLSQPESITSDDRINWSHSLKFGPLNTEQQQKLREFIINQRRQRLQLTMI